MAALEAALEPNSVARPARGALAVKIRPSPPYKVIEGGGHGKGDLFRKDNIRLIQAFFHQSLRK